MKSPDRLEVGTGKNRTLPLVVATIALASLTGILSWKAPIPPEFWFWLVATFVTEALWVRLPRGGATTSMASCVHFAILFSLTRGHAMAVAAISVLFSELVFMHKPARRALFNTAQTSLSVAGASLALQLCHGIARDGGPSLSAPGLFAALAAASVYFAINTLAVSWAVATEDRVAIVDAWKANFASRGEMLSNAVLFALGLLLASLYQEAGAMGAAVIALPVLLAYEESSRRFAQATPPRQRTRRAA